MSQRISSIRALEEEQFESASDCPLWPEVYFARELLRSEMEEISRFKRARGEDELVLNADLTSRQAREAAILRLSGLSLRALGSAIALVSCGYVPEAQAALRRLRESVLRVRSVDDDASGEHARAWLSGRPMRGLAHLEGRYGGGQIAKRLSIAAHADVAGLLPLESEKESRMQINLAPQRNDKVVEPMSRMMTAEILMLMAHLLSCHTEYMPSTKAWRAIERLERVVGARVFLRSESSLHLEASPGRYIPMSSHDFSLWEDDCKSVS